MNITKWISLNLIGMILITIMLTAIQTTLWFQVFSHFPSPLLWLNVFLYIALYRKPIEGIIIIYILSWALSAFTAMPLGLLWLNSFIIFSIVNIIKSRFFWPDAKYFVIASLFSSLIYQVVSFGTAAFFDGIIPALNVQIRFFEVLLTPITALPIFIFLKQLDQWTRDDIMSNLKTSNQQANNYE